MNHHSLFCNIIGNGGRENLELGKHSGIKRVSPFLGKRDEISEKGNKN